MSTPALWLTIFGAGAVTFAVRLSFIALLNGYRYLLPSDGRCGSCRRRC